LVVM